MRLFILIFKIYLILFSLGNSTNIEIKKISGKTSKFEIMEMTFDDYRIYNHRQGAIKIRRISDNQQLVVFSDKFKVKYYNDGEKLFNFILDEKKNEVSVQYQGIELFTWIGKHVPKYQAYFFQVISYDNQPFHYYIKLKGGKAPIALNINKFDNKIAKAISKAKIRIAANYNMTPEQIDLILKRRQIAIDKKVENIIDEKKRALEKSLDDTVKSTVDQTMQASLSQQIEKEIGDTIGKEIAKEFDAIIVEGMEDEFASIVDEAVQEAINEGISAATAEAAIRAVMEVFERGGTEQEAMNACRAIAGDAC